jgi:hypothetical protein
MPNLNICGPASSAPADRMALSVNWVRPGASAIGGAARPRGAYLEIGLPA